MVYSYKIHVLHIELLKKKVKNFGGPQDVKKLQIFYVEFSS